MSTDTNATTETAGAGLARRKLITGVGMGAAAAVVATRMSVPAQAQVIHDSDVLNFALNLEYLEATYYSYAVTGADIPASLTTGVGTPGTVTVPSNTKITFSTTLTAQLANEVYQDELGHVKFVREALGSAAVARPSLDFVNGFNKLAAAAGLGAVFNAFASDPVADVPFLLATFGFEDVGVTAYAGGSTLLQNKAILSAAARILPVEAYHAASARLRILQAGGSAVHAANAISNARGAASAAAGPGADDQGVRVTVNGGGATSDTGVVNIVPSDANFLAYARTPAQVLNIVYVGGASSGYGFFPNQLNGTVR